MWNDALHFLSVKFSCLLINTKSSNILLVSVIIAVIKYHDERNLRRKAFIFLNLNITVNRRRKLGKELKLGRNLLVGADTETAQECYFLDCSSWKSQSSFL